MFRELTGADERTRTADTAHYEPAINGRFPATRSCWGHQPAREHVGKAAGKSTPGGSGRFRMECLILLRDSWMAGHSTTASTNESQRRPSLLLVDALNLIRRVYAAQPARTDRSGRKVESLERAIAAPWPARERADARRVRVRWRRPKLAS